MSERLPPDDVWMAQLRTLVRGAQRSESAADVDRAHAAIEELEARVLLEARFHASRAVALVALLLQDSEDADDELEKLHAVLHTLIGGVGAALDQAIQRRGVELGVVR